MAARPNRPQLVAVDANVLFDLADGLDDVVDAVSIIRERLRDARFLIPPTVQHDIWWQSASTCGQESNPTTWRLARMNPCVSNPLPMCVEGKSN